MRILGIRLDRGTVAELADLVTADTTVILMYSPSQASTHLDTQDADVILARRVDHNQINILLEKTPLTTQICVLRDADSPNDIKLQRLGIKTVDTPVTASDLCRLFAPYYT